MGMGMGMKFTAHRLTAQSRGAPSVPHRVDSRVSSPPHTRGIVRDVVLRNYRKG